MASDIQRGTRKMDAGDWIRLKRLQGGKNFLTDMSGDVTNPNPLIVAKSGRPVFTEFGASKIRRPASSYTDYAASRSADYILESYNRGSGKTLLGNRLCNCSTFDPVNHTNKCMKCGR